MYFSFNNRKKARHDSEEQYYMGSKATSLLSSEMEELSGVVYRPRTKETRATYELMLSFIQHNIGDQVCVSVCVCVYVCVCMCVFVCVLCVSVCVYVFVFVCYFAQLPVFIWANIS